nr:hypothetical protein [Tanacetum cinerariifolium]GFB76379.1 hypothetical protein [Tanacetum cinerariifolium]
MLPEMLEDPYVEVALQAPPSLDYIPGPEEPKQAPPSPDYVLGLEHTDDEIEEEEHPAPIDSLVVAPTTADQVPFAEETEPFETDEFAATPPLHPAYQILQGAPVSTDMELGGYVREFETRVRQDIDEIYMTLDDEQTERQLLAGRLNMLFRDRRAHAYTRQLMVTEARMSREAWVRVTHASDLIHGKVMSLRTTVLGQMSEIREL